MPVTFWYVTVGLLLIGMAFASRPIKRLPLTPAMLYLAAGIGLGPLGLRAITLDPVRAHALLERLAEGAVLVSLLAAGLKARVPLFEPRWWVPVRLATITMALTAALLAAAGVWLLGLPVGEAVLLAGILAPTDPVLASQVSVSGWTDRDRLRLGLTGEAGVNDTTAFPVVLLGLGLMGLEDLGVWGWKWLAVDVLWGVSAGLLIGTGLGAAAGRLIKPLHRLWGESAVPHDFLALGLLALAYGASTLVGGYGFLAAFSLGSALRLSETGQLHWDNRGEPEGRMPTTSEPGADLPGLPGTILQFDRHLERLAEFGLLLLLGAMLRWEYLGAAGWWLVPLLLLVIRPVSVYASTIGTGVSPVQRRLMAWFGIRGIGSVYYLAYALGRGLPPEVVPTLISLTFTTVMVSVVVHGVSVTPLLRWYGSRSSVPARGP